MIGKKIDCPKCKYRFVVEAPPEKEAEETAPEAEAKKTKATTAGGTGAGKTKEAIQAKSKVNGQAAKTAVKANGKAAPAKAKARPGADGSVEPQPASDEDGSAAEMELAPAKQPGAKNKKLMLGLVLAGVGVAVLVVAAVLIFSKKPPNTNKPGAGSGGPLANKKQPEEQQADNGKPAGESKDKEPVKVVEQPPEPQLGAAGPEFTNLLPNDSQHVLHVYFKNAFHPASPLVDVTFPRPDNGLAFSKEELTQRLGFPALAIDDLIRAESFTAPWTFTIVHTTRAVEEKDLVRALNLEAVKASIGGQAYFVAKQRLAWLEELGQLALGAAEYLRGLRAGQKERPLYVCLHNPQTVIFADEEPLTTFLRNGGRFKYRTELPAQKNDPAPRSAPPGDNVPPGFPPGLPKPPAGLPQGKGFQTFQQPQAPPGVPGAQPGGPKPPSGLPVPGGTPVAPGAKPNSPGTPNTLPNVGKPAVPAPAAPAPAGVVAGDALGANTYMTINRTMKDVLDRLETRPAGSKDKVFFSAVTDMDAARLVTKDPDFQDHLLWHFRQLWDVTQLIQEKKTRVHYLGVSLQQKGTKLYRYKNELVCSEAAQAKEVALDLIDQGAPRVLKFFDRVLARHRVDLNVGVEPDKKKGKPAGANQPGATSPPGFQPGGGTQPPGKQPGDMPKSSGGFQPPGGGNFRPPGGGGLKPPGGGSFSPPGGSGSFSPPGGSGSFSPPKAGGFPNNPGTTPGAQPSIPPRPATDDDELANSRLTINATEERVEFTLDLLLDQAAFAYMYEIARLFVQGLKSQMDLAEAKSYRHKLGKASRELGVNGLSSRNVPPGFFPPGAFKRPEIYRSGRDPSQRVSWMAGLLPFLGRQELHNFINFDHSWRDPSNWLAGRTLVPEFLDPSYPISSRRVLNPELPFELAATHYVGIAGVGLDAADYPANDPAYDFKRGILGYDSSRGLKEVERGLSNTVLMIQVPHDGPAGVTPWLAGGGSTLRGVPEKNSIAPFVLSTDKGGKPIEHNGKRGTYAVMADGSVRFISAKISDDTFKAMCTAKGAPPDNAALSEWAPEVPPPAAVGKEKTSKKTPAASGK